MVDETPLFSQEDHQVAFIFDPEEHEGRERSKRRRVERDELFVPLLNGEEKDDDVKVREGLFRESWGVMEGRIEDILRDSNAATLQQVSSFVAQASTQCGDGIPSAFIITGPNFASQDLLFTQLSERLRADFSSRFVRLRSTEAVNVKATLKKIIREATSADLDEEDVLVDRRRYLDYDLEALEAFVGSQGCEHVFVGFQDSEAFDSALLCDMISLFSSWRPRIPFTLLFGIATSVELLQARLLRSACRLVYGAQFDCVQTEAILETVFKGVVASADVPLRLGAGLLKGMLDRQRDQVAGIQAFISSLKYAYMCHFYANPLSILLAPGVVLRGYHYEAMRNLPSVRLCVEEAVDKGTRESLQLAKSLVEDDEHLLAATRAGAASRKQYVESRLRCLLVVQAVGASPAKFSASYVETMAKGISESAARVADCVRQMDANTLSKTLHRVVDIYAAGDASLHLPQATTSSDLHLLTSVRGHLERLDALRQEARDAGIALRSKYSAQAKVVRTTVIAQRVQLSRDSAALRPQDAHLTSVIDATASLLTALLSTVRGPEAIPLSEAWTYESKSPLRDVMVPRPRATFERSLARPHDYLSCACCAGHGAAVKPTAPATCILYHLYLEAGSLINVADLWSAFYAIVGDHTNDDDEDQEEKNDERLVLAMFYRGLAELRALGYVRASKKKTDHVAKVRWL